MCRTPCKYPGQNIAFHVNVGSTAYWLSLLVEFEDGDGDIGSMQIKEVHIFVIYTDSIKYVRKNKLNLTCDTYRLAICKVLLIDFL